MMTIDDYLNDLEAGIEHDVAVWYLRENQGCSLNDLLGFMEYMLGGNDNEGV